MSHHHKKQTVHCCKTLKIELHDKYSPLYYCKKLREYAIQDFESDSIVDMIYCPFCGTKQPLPLRDEWFDILEQEYKIDRPDEEGLKKVPSEFLTDEWWKKRGL